MAYHINVASDLIGEMHTAAVRSAQSAKTAWDTYAAERVKIDEDTPGTIPVPGRVKMERRQAARTAALAKVPTVDDVAAHRATLAELRRSLDLDELIPAANFFPPPSGGEASLHYQHVVANEMARTAYARRVSRMDPQRLAEEAERVARATVPDPRGNDGLAKIDVLNEVIGSRTSPEWAPARSAVMGARAHVESNWRDRTAALGLIGEAERKLNQTESYASGLRDGTTPNTAYLEFEAKRTAQAA